MAMFTDQIDKLKREYTDKYVMVDAARPELARFKDIPGQVKTVNMSGRALVEFMDYHLNIGWYDIDPAFLKVVDKPPPKVEKPKAEKKPAAPKAEAKPQAAAKAAAPAKPQATPAAGKMSVAEMMAAARGGKGGAAAPAKAAEAEAKSKSDVAPVEKAEVKAAKAPAAPVAKTQAEPAPASDDPASIRRRVDRTKMSVADMIAYCRKVDARG